MFLQSTGNLCLRHKFFKQKKKKKSFQNIAYSGLDFRSVYDHKL